MKYLKFFEGVEDTQMGISTDEVKECFYDLTDEGWTVVVKFDKKLKSQKNDNKPGMTEILMDLIPFLEIKIHKGHVNKISDTELIRLEQSELYKDCISKLKGRIDEHGLVVINNPKYNHSCGQVEQLPNGGFQIFILIYRKSDENYAKKI